MRSFVSRRLMQGAEPTLDSSGDTGHGRRLTEIEETLEVTRKSVDRGGYRVTKRVESSEHRIDEPMRNERVEIERVPMNIELVDGVIPAARQEGNTWILPVVEERLVLVKRMVQVEEVRITRVHGTHRDPQTITLRKEAIDIERLAPEDSSVADRSQPPTPSGKAANTPSGA